MNILDKMEVWHQNEIITGIEKEFVRLLIELDKDVSKPVLLAAASCVFAQQQGHLCIDLSNPESLPDFLFEDENTGIQIDQNVLEIWENELQRSKLVSQNGELAPLVLENRRLYFHRFWKYEEELTKWIKQRSSVTNAINKQDQKILAGLLRSGGDLFEVDWQQVAVCLSFLKDLVVISGGPGTGKTYTVLNIIAAQAKAHPEEKFKIALAAPTGKAARRLINSIEEGKVHLPDIFKDGIELPEHALTVHKLLGADHNGSNFKFDQDNQLPYDLVIVDEASMLDITMWVRLIRAVGPDTKLIVLGDKDQLASVEAGSILGDICGGENSFSEQIAATVGKLTGASIPVAKNVPSVNDCIVFLTKSYRFGEQSGIQKLAEAINRADPTEVLKVLKDPEFSDVAIIEPSRESIDKLIETFSIQHYEEYNSKSQDLRMKEANRKKILCAIRKSDLGVEQLNSWSEYRIKRKNNLLTSNEWYDGRPVMATRNDAILRIRNGEIGLYNEEQESVIFEGEQDVVVSPTRLSGYEPAFAITIHKSQGSEFENVAIVLPSKENSILSKEILYTAVTRARLNTLLVAHEEIVIKSVLRSVSRNSGVRHKLWE
ncbi:exodeoxyribonuclease V subunit alpha [Gracilimonas halophila]|uniref:Exodeoxyribonuclease V subunit alpha n=1 Tax=Gracilimonas halophila TaxID=1834464 RepID=A0ABW5JL35_9BACT